MRFGSRVEFLPAIYVSRQGNRDKFHADKRRPFIDEGIDDRLETGTALPQQSDIFLLLLAS
jgi:hypothetical protein